MLKSTLIALLAFAATVSAQAPELPHIYFTQPVSEKPGSFTPGSVEIFSWQGACNVGTKTSSTPTAAKVELIDSTDSNNAVFRKEITKIDCTQPQGNVKWDVPTDLNPDALYSLQIVLTPQNAYSGKFNIKGANTPAPSNNTAGSGDKTPKSAAAGFAPAALSAAVAAVAGAVILF
ncbi:hypothetical protein DFQ26_005665 [Actinomortierella ambigua]|nr:hypothetical protein DFQ26_005665 [Actinomortierella ambigua]